MTYGQTTPLVVPTETGATVNAGVVSCGQANFMVTLNWANDCHKYSGVLGRNWQIPLLDSTLTQVNNSAFEWITTSGKQVVVYSDAEDLGVKVIHCPDGTFQIDDKISGWKYFYKNGRISEIHTSDNEVLRFVRNVGGATLLVNGRATVKVSSEGSDKARVVVAGNSFLFSKGKLASLQKSAGRPVVEELREEFNKVFCNQEVIFEIRDDLADNGSISRTALLGNQDVRYYFRMGVWSVDPKVLSTPSNDILFRMVNGTSRAVDSEGTIYERNVFQGGPLNGKIRFERITSKAHKTMRRFRYDEKGNCIGSFAY